MEYTAEQLNFFRLCYILFEIVPEGLRTIFKQEWDASYKIKHGQWGDTPASYTAFENMESVRNRLRNKRLLGLMSSGDRKEWDCTCLFYAILYSDSVGRKLTSVVKKSVDEIREIRNDLVHNTTGKISETEFQTYTQKIKKALSSLKLDITKIDEIENQKHFPTEELTKIQEELQKTREELKKVEIELEDEKKRNAAPNSFCVLPPGPSHDTVDREKEVDKIYEAMQTLSKKNGKTTLVYLSGNPGSGKSVMAKYIGEKCYDQDDSTETLKFVMTLDASNLDTLLNSYMVFAEKLNCYPDSITSITTSKDLTKEEQILQLKALTGKQVDKYSAWWIIADNVTDIKMFSKYWPQGGGKTCGEGQVLVTTQDSSSIGVTLGLHYHHVSISSGMVEEDALELLSKVSGYTNAENDVMLKVCKALDFQPLALSSTAVYVRSVRNINEQYTWLECLNDLHREREKLEKVYEKTSLAYKTTMTAAVNLALKREISEEIMLHTFRFLSVIASEPIPLKYIVEYVAKVMPDEDKNTVAVRICSSSLVRVQGAKEISIHQVVFYCLQNKDITENTVDIFFVISAFSLIPVIDDKFLADGLAITRPLVNHLVKLAGQVNKYAIIKESTSGGLLDDSFCGVLDHLSTVLFKHSIFESARDFLNLVLALQLSSFELSKTRELLKALKESNHIDYISNVNINAILPSVGDTMNDLGMAYQELERHHESKTYYEKALAIKTAAHSENHPSLGITMGNLGSAYQKLGRLEEARIYHEKALAIATDANDENKSLVADIMVNLGNTYRELGRLQESMEYCENGLGIKMAVYGENDPQVIVNLNNLGLTYRKLGWLKESLQCHENALAITTATYSEIHPLGANTMNNLGAIYQKLGRLQEAKEIYEKAIHIHTAVYGKNNRFAAAPMCNLGTAYEELGQLQESIKCYKSAFAISTTAYGDNHPDVAKITCGLGSAYQKLGQLQESIECYEKALAIFTGLYGENHPSVGLTMSKFASVYQKQGKLQKSMECYKTFLDIYTTVWGENHPFVAEPMNNLGTAYRELGRLQESITCHEKALTISTLQAVHNPLHVADILYNLGNTYQESGRLQESIVCNEKALAIYTRLFGENHTSVNVAKKNLAAKYEERGRAFVSSTLRKSR